MRAFEYISMKKYLSLFKLLVLTVILLLPLYSHAASDGATEWQYSPENEGAIRLISPGIGGLEADADEYDYAGIHIKFKDNWKTYWKHVGDTGLPLSLKSDRSVNIGDVEVLWPYPKRFDYYGIETWGYKNEVVLPVRFKIKDKTKPIYLGFNVKWAICDEICIFEDNILSLMVKPEVRNDSHQEILGKFLGKIPSEISDGNELAIKSYDYDSEKITIRFSVKPDNDESKNNAGIFTGDLDLFLFEKGDNFKFPKPEVKISEGGKEVTFVTKYQALIDGLTLSDKELEYNLVLNDRSFEGMLKLPSSQVRKAQNKLANIVDNSAVEEKSNIDNSTKDQYVTSSEKSYDTKKDYDIFLILIFAFLGGLILNIMPCVLPVLSIKIMSIIKHGESDKSYIRKSFLSTIAGILTSFVILAFGVIGLKYFGHSVSWGMQFQQPEFLIFLSVIVTLFACNQFGFFEVNLSNSLNNKLNDKIDGAGGDSSVFGNFLTGAFATLLATPCTAPFLSTAIAFSLGAGVEYIILVFLFMGLGLSLPYILILISPSLVKIFPKPGAWMSKVKVVLGIFLICTSFWLVYVMANNAGIYSALMLAFCLFIIIGFLKFISKRDYPRSRVIMVTLYLSAVSFIMPLYYASIEMEPDDLKDKWVAYEEGLIEEYVDSGRVVFVDVTADWCLTCKFNKARVVSKLTDFFESEEVILIKADYTKPSMLIQKYLEKNDAYAIPFNKVYGPKAVEGIKLPEILTKESIMQAVKSAK